MDDERLQGLTWKSSLSLRPGVSEGVVLQCPHIWDRLRTESWDGARVVWEAASLVWKKYKQNCPGTFPSLLSSKSSPLVTLIFQSTASLLRSMSGLSTFLPTVCLTSAALLYGSLQILKDTALSILDLIITLPTAFTAPTDHFRFKHMLLGLCNSPFTKAHLNNNVRIHCVWIIPSISFITPVENLINLSVDSLLPFWKPQRLSGL